MHICRVQIANFRNFKHLDVRLAPNAVVVGENRVGKSNFVFALRLVLDAGLSEAARNLRLSDIWDGCDPQTSPSVEVHIDFSGFDDDPAMTALLTDYRLADDHTTSRLSYAYMKRAEVTGPPASESDYEYRMYGGGVETTQVRGDTRRRICLEVLNALRDAESDLGAWRSSPLRPLLEDAISQVPKSDIEQVADDVTAATVKLGQFDPVQSLASELRAGIADMAGPVQDLNTTLGFASTDALRLFRSIGLYIDDGKRAVGEASLGSANLALLALKLKEFAWRSMKNERNYTVVCVEEPEAHLHPHLQRRVCRQLMTGAASNSVGIMLTTHSPNIASVTPLASLVLLRSVPEGHTEGWSLAHLGLGELECEDLQRYLDVSRAEILFSRGVVFVEGDAEEALVPVFAQTIGLDLDSLAISVCNVGGVNFRPYVKLARSLSLPFVVITDWDPLDGSKPPLGAKRALDLMDDVRGVAGEAPLGSGARGVLCESELDLRRQAEEEAGVFMNSSTLEIQIAETPSLMNALLSVLDDQGFGARRQARLLKWREGSAPVDAEQMLAMVADIGKGRLAGRLAAKTVGLTPPDYIRRALESIAAHG